MECPFCEIVAGRAEAHLVQYDADAVAFLDRRPLFPGHTLVVPPVHVETLTDLPASALPGYFARVQAVAGAVQRGTDSAGSFVAANNRVSQSVPHLHFHIVPRNPKDGLRGFFWPRCRYPDEAAAAETARRVRDELP